MEMINKFKDIEIMAPVGSFESLSAAIKAGAGSVYFGIDKLNMRSKSSINFSLHDLKEIVRKCKLFGIKTYLTLNTVMYDNDLSLMQEIVDAAKEFGISSIIAVDISVIQYARSKNVKVHLSTQVNISNSEAVKFYSQYADVMVLARELSLEQVRNIYENINKYNICGPSGDRVKLEIFVHGALCMAISGKCYLSLHQHNKSANMGACLQNCRREYLVKDRDLGYELVIENEYIMSPKDLCTIGFIDKIIESGATVFKIEGRGRSADYVRTTVESYKEAVQSYFSNQYNQENIERWNNNLNNVFNRGFWDGYYLGKRLGEWTEKYGSSSKKRKVQIGKANNYFSKLKVGTFLIQSYDLEVGDEILVTGPTTGAETTIVKEIRVDNQIVEKAYKGTEISIPLEFKVRRSDKLFKVILANEKIEQL